MNFLKKNFKLILIALIGIIILAAFATNMYMKQHKKIDVLADRNIVKMKYDGYEKQGTASFNLNDLQMAVIKAQLDQTKLPKTIKAQVLFNAKDGEQAVKNIDSAINTAVPKNKQILSTLKMWYEETTIKLDKDSQLKNGDKINLTVKTNGDDTNPVKDGGQSFTVNGLKLIKEIPTSKVLDKINVKFAGANGKGEIAILADVSSELQGQTIYVKNNGNLSNGDVLNITIPDSWFEATKGSKYVGSKVLSKTVSGLIDSKSTNIKALKHLMDKAITDEYPYDEDDPSSIAPQFEGFFAFPFTDRGLYYNQKQVTVNNDMVLSVPVFSFVAVYMLPDAHGSKTGRAATVTLNNPSFNGNNVNLPSINDLYINSDIDDSVNSVLQESKVDGALVINKSN